MSATKTAETIADMRELTLDELQQQIEATRKELFEARFKKSLHQLENTATLSKLKRRVAQLRTVLQQKHIQQTQAS
ncbi:MAG: 50S ribosomal protein L29 [Candidatus Melainabacteria bacterium]